MKLPDVYAARRSRVLAALGGGGGDDASAPARPAILAPGIAGALVLPSAPELFVGNDGELRYLPDADLYYLTGYAEPGAVLVLCPSAASPFTLFVRPRDPERERWTGVRGGEEAARERFGADAAHPLDRLDVELPKLTAEADVLYAPLESGRTDVDAAIRSVLAAGRRARPRTGRGPHAVADGRRFLAPLRLRKDDHELGLIREAADITVDAFAETARMMSGAAGEWQVEAALEQAFRRAGAAGPAFPSIVAGGANATVLHYVQNDAPLTPGEMLLVDAGARYRMYCADISRTWPVGGRFTDVQRAAYDVVRRAHDAALAAVGPGRGAGAMHEAAVRVLAEGMISLDLLDGTIDDVIARGEYRRYFPHRTSHWLGLDVHDVGDYVDGAGSDVRLEAGMVLTLEPGLYVPADDQRAPAALRGIGIRLEDDVVVTASGCDVLTAGLPLDPDDVEALLG